jgi:TetR/AcrR family transcriptional repressor of nem operon
VRYPAEHKEEVRERIVDAASRRFRRAGAGVGIGQLMKALKLTHGGFYRHFKSKDDLFAAALTKAFEDSRERITQMAAEAEKGRELEALISFYLSDYHCAEVAGGCPVAALAPEIARYRHSRAVRSAMDRCVREQAAFMSRYMKGRTEEERQQRALALLSGMAGSLALARAVSDEGLRQSILSGAREYFQNNF